MVVSNRGARFRGQGKFASSIGGGMWVLIFLGILYLPTGLFEQSASVMIAETP